MNFLRTFALIFFEKDRKNNNFLRTFALLRKEPKSPTSFLRTFF